MQSVASMRLFLTFFLLAFLCQNCDSGPSSADSVDPPPVGSNAVKPTIWRGTLDLGEKTLPFNFELELDSEKPEMVILNAEERIPVPDVRRKGDSILIQMPFFDSEFQTILQDDSLIGIWYNRARKNHNRLPFHALAQDDRRFMPSPNGPSVDVSGKWEVTFVHQETDTSKAIGVFAQNGPQITGTFLTSTGDYRYLEGSVAGNEISLSCFDGAHAFLFEAQLNANEELKGGFWSGAHWYESWSAVRNPDFAIDHPDSLTWMKEGHESISFAFPNADSQIVSLADDRYQDKVVLVEIMGSWCPNCKDETALLHEMYQEMEPEGLEIISLSFELRDDFSYAAEKIKRMEEVFGLEYEVLFAGRAGRRTAGAALPMLNHVMSYHTTLFVDRKGKVRRIHTGFSGPATGEVYTRLVTDFRKFTRELLAESPV